ncbi:hypothetical protein [Bacillus sp. B-jedd]|uniref:hypothetical protein n=1 Tax=Bacillus sp. B-jedd TaxID=1476857 RepID=UPI000A517302|nr:hypothetical protein [Bacillus sp. B-jedd]
MTSDNLPEKNDILSEDGMTSENLPAKKQYPVRRWDDFGQLASKKATSCPKMG